MSDRGEIAVRPGFAEALRGEVARLVWQGFGARFGSALGPEMPARAFLERVIDRARTLTALDGGQLVGVAGTTSAEQRFLDVKSGDAAVVYGRVAALRRAPLIAATERSCGPRELRLDGVAIAERADADTVLRALLAAAVEEARRSRVEVLTAEMAGWDRAAMRLYEEWGFEPAGRSAPSAMARLAGLRPAALMRLEVARAGRL